MSTASIVMSLLAILITLGTMTGQWAKLGRWMDDRR